ncbi:type II CRISPR-associated endonuclease Cas1 [Hydrotalea sp.]|uniref:type II CRISPR-associated endonuclease Cas1 n=1 Tax=Hydrotalea sp. TaxID=2881279 RepID=UPI00258493C5|nr:type II CRISPR-associated endonuclease Cas1 [Hydrotalea sp.]
MLKRTLCIENPCHLKCNNEQLVLSYAHIKGLEDRQDKTVPIEDIGVLVLEHPQITITHFLLDQLITNNIAVITCNSTHHPSGMLLPLESHTLQSERFKEQLAASEPLKKQLWQQTVKAKINNQAAVLKKWNIPHGYLNNARQNVKSGDADNAEAKAAAYYWAHLFPDAWQFFRKREGPPPNNLLNYGYAIIRAAMARAIAGAGLLPTLGIFHRNRYNAYCLADDMMEPYRPFIDAIVRNIIYETSAVEVLTQPLKVQLLNVLTHDTRIEEQTSPLWVAMQKTAFSLSKCYSGEQRKLDFPELPLT